jgi:hypothetical protein
LAALSEYVGALTRAPVGGAPAPGPAPAPAPGCGPEQEADGAGGYLMNFSVVNIYSCGPGEWRRSPAEARAWELVSRALEVLTQRSSVVAEGDRPLLRLWYEALCAIGATLHSSGGAGQC